MECCSICGVEDESQYILVLQRKPEHGSLIDCGEANFFWPKLLDGEIDACTFEKSWHVCAFSFDVCTFSCGFSLRHPC